MGTNWLSLKEVATGIAKLHNQRITVLMFKMQHRRIHSIAEA